MKKLLAIAAAAVLASPAAWAQTYSFAAALSPEVTGATGSGTVLMTFDEAAQTLRIESLWFGLSGTTTVAHVHCCTALAGTGTAGVAVTPGTLPGFPVGTTFGSYDVTLDLTQNSTYGGAFLSGSGGTAAGASARLFTGLSAGTAYFNIHSSTFTGGEIRGFTQAVPEPATWGLMALGMAAVGAAARRRRA
jgi:CHRD domain/PEP-CTERM motif